MTSHPYGPVVEEKMCDTKELIEPLKLALDECMAASEYLNDYDHAVVRDAYYSLQRAALEISQAIESISELDRHVEDGNVLFE